MVNNYEDSYSGIASLRSATASSDNSVYAELGLKVGHAGGSPARASGWASGPRSRPTRP